MDSIHQTKQAITIKLILFYGLLILDMISCTFIETHFDINSSMEKVTPSIPLTIIQMVITAMLVVMLFVLMWQTLPLRYGLLKELWRDFKYPISLSFLQMFLVIGQRTMRLINFFKYGKQTDSLIWADGTYSLLYYLKYILYPIFYGTLIDGSLKMLNIGLFSDKKPDQKAFYIQPYPQYSSEIPKKLMPNFLGICFRMLLLSLTYLSQQLFIFIIIILF